MGLIRILRTAAVTVTHTFYIDGAATDATGNVTATLRRLDGTLVNTATATHPGPPGVYTYPVPASAVLDTQRLEWSGTFGGVTVVSPPDYIEHVGGFLFGIAEARAAHRYLADVNRYPDTLLTAKRIEVENEFENICGQAFVPRYKRYALHGRGYEQLGTPDSMLRTVRSVSVGGVAFAQADLDAIACLDQGVLRRPTGAIWPAGYRNVLVEYEHGWDYPPPEIAEAGILRLRSRLSMTSTDIPDRAISFTPTEGGTYRLSTPSRDRIGIPEIDGVLQRPFYTRRPRPAIA
jgi:hypothetical protein